MIREQYEIKAADAFEPLAKAAMSVKLDECMVGGREESPEFTFKESFRETPYEKGGVEPFKSISVAKIWEKAAASSEPSTPVSPKPAESADTQSSKVENKD